MKALVLSGEAGTRLRPPMHTSAEQPLPVANKAVSFHGPTRITDAGITRAGVLVGDITDLAEANLVSGPQEHTSVADSRLDTPAGTRTRDSFPSCRAAMTAAPSVPLAHRPAPGDHGRVQIPS